MEIDTSYLEKALNSLNEVLELEETPIIRDSAIQRFEYTYELAIKLLKRKLEEMASSAEEIDHMGFKDIIRTGAEKGLIDKPEAWFEFREKRNITSHTYDEKKAEEVYDILKDFSDKVGFLLSKLDG
ncbi:MAG: nucleotidyltransferase [Alphaproteobacteria bacterium CG11_big_fil_rev_8_21_14_0_20_39_49]|nr:MAG: nucleotidyltransferase [Alphaproteobacteria bacterium CG11_big_fil_rev_8_21_14_0_20_39_49]